MYRHACSSMLGLSKLNLLLVPLVLLQAPSGGGPEAFSRPVPKELRGEADRAFRDGAVYFIWPEQPGPFLVPAGQSLKIPLQYALGSRSQAVPFWTVVELHVVQNGKPATLESTWTGRAKSEQGTEIWRAVGLVWPASGEQLSGKGSASIYLIRESDREAKSKKPISNRVDVPVSFE